MDITCESLEGSDGCVRDFGRVIDENGKSMKRQ